MGFRFRKSISLLPGVRLNLSKRGGSVSLGEKGSTVNFGASGERTTFGLPGSGLSYSRYTPYGKRGGAKGWLWVALGLLVAGLRAFQDKIPFLDHIGHF